MLSSAADPNRNLSLTSPEELERLLHAGMGRAILAIKEQGLASHRDLVLDCCVHKRAYDPQCEESRAEYLYPLIRMSEEAQWFPDAIIGALTQAHDLFDAEQLFDLAVLLARDGDAAARRAIYDKFRRNDAAEAFVGARALVTLDGTDGLVAGLDFIGCYPSDGYWDQENDYLIRQAEEQDGIEAVRQALQAASSTMRGVAEYLERIGSVYSPFNSSAEIKTIREETRARRRARPDGVPADTLWWEVKQHPNFDRIAVQWAQEASDEELRNAAADLTSENNEKRLCRQLQMFFRRPFPVHPKPLIELASSTNETIAWRALSALHNVAHEEVRALSMRLMQDPKWRETAIGLLRHNYLPGDNKLILQLLERETDVDSFHGMGIHLRDVYKQNPSPEGLQPLFLVYEKGPCSCCRYGVVEMIDELGELPRWMAEECLYDADSETRELAAKLLAD